MKFLKDLDRLKKSKGKTKKEMADEMALIRLPKWMHLLAIPAPTLIVMTMWIGASTFSLLFYDSLISIFGNGSYILKLIIGSFVVLAFAFSFVSIGIFVSYLGRFGIIEGKFPRATWHPIYSLRRVYGTAWTQIFYFKPLYSACLAIPFLKKLLFRGFGFKGSLSFVTYPDSWIRDLPLLMVGKNVYLANRCTVGTNLCLNDGSILVGPCSFADNSMVGHLAIFGLGCKLGESSELGVGASLGIRVKVGEQVAISPRAVVYHAVNIGNRAKIGGCAVIGTRAQIGEDVQIPFGAVIPPGAIISNQMDSDRYFQMETQKMEYQKNELVGKLRMALNDDAEEKN